MNTGSQTRSTPAAFAPFRNLHALESMVVCGCGQPLAVPPVRFTTIGVNDVVRLFDPTYLVDVNPPRQFRGDSFRNMLESQA
jgi:hypothetical protein